MTISNIEELSIESVVKILRSSEPILVYLKEPPKNMDKLKVLNEKIFKLRKDSFLELMWTSKNIWSDLSFLLELTEAERLSINEGGLCSLEEVSQLKDLKELFLKTVYDVSLKPLQKFTNLRKLHLFYIQKDIEVISNFTNLEVLHLKYMNISDLSFLRPLKNLRKLYIEGDEFTDLDILPEVGQIDYLSLNDTSGLKNLDFIGKMPHLIQLDLFNLPWKALPVFPEYSSIESIRVDLMNDLENLTGIENLKNLREFLCMSEMQEEVKVRLQKQYEAIGTFPTPFNDWSGDPKHRKMENWRLSLEM